MPGQMLGRCLVDCAALKFAVGYQDLAAFWTAARLKNASSVANLLPTLVLLVNLSLRHP